MFFTRSPYHPKPRALGQWLLVVAALVFGIVIVGGITRLTESGLSIVTWDPILGTLPPLTHAQWQAAFDAYKAIPQYAAFNKSMTLEGFQHIYFWEYLHRLLARGIGTVLGIVLLVFWWKSWIPRGYGRRIVLILALGGLQGLIGWWMVASGLQDRVEVSHLRLATHLLAAMLIYGVLIWTALDLFGEAKGQPRARLLLDPASAIFALAVQLMLGAFTAGLRAGYAFSSWPLMGDHFFPQGGWAPQGIAFNLFYNPVVVQFIHRWWAWVVVMVALLLAQSAWKKGGRVAGIHAIVLVALQVVLGIATLLTGVLLPIAVAHQAVAALLLACFVWCAHVVGTAPRR
ncbi:cytochrome c oxidase assembly protein subunit 15 [Sphingomonas vulcanisoli]|uniref:Heme A synthase n=1 Tax=Sphingomonas vulcanisoli TaxID=1658060 RepID=A0ABX0TVN4_9SPHN|nr:COX15/CtaA family protein [Sphingomonas vulcanisoli]NIJ07840.1 cytochrome c oxidase assembly protein subunit 15 [Sphingomonas vulcanisoli]